MAADTMLTQEEIQFVSAFNDQMKKLVPNKEGIVRFVFNLEDCLIHSFYCIAVVFHPLNTRRVQPGEKIIESKKTVLEEIIQYEMDSECVSYLTTEETNQLINLFRRF